MGLLELPAAALGSLHGRLHWSVYVELKQDPASRDALMRETSLMTF